MKEVVVIGGGVVGLCSAYYLQKMGHNVSVIDKSKMEAGASYVNAGYISPSHFIPLAAPGVVRQGLKWMLDSSSPFFIKPRIDRHFLNWFWAFNRSCNKTNVSNSIIPIKDLALLGQRLFKEIKEDEDFDFHMESKGIMVLCKTNSFLEKERKMIDLVQEYGMEASLLSKEQLQQLEPHYELDVLGGSLYKCDWHSTPNAFMQEMKKHLLKVGVKFYPEEVLKDVSIKKGRIESISTKNRVLEADEFILAAGAWSGLLAKKFGVNILMEAGKGYRINTTVRTGISMPAILAENKVAVTPMKEFTRFAGTMELSGINGYIRKERIESIANSIPKYYKGFKVSDEERAAAQCGLRPLTPDGKPYIGKSRKYSNLSFATGHGMMGWTMGPSSGKLVAQLVSGEVTSIGLEAFHPDRRF